MGNFRAENYMAMQNIKNYVAEIWQNLKFSNIGEEIEWKGNRFFEYLG